ncbi:FHA domain-containing protein [Myxococcus sp. K38C18041901]|uniref:FHA domain-containing protein n=1 Tax=Myxococcus guangdongensis TaxID=2906760 RepID=UPI0020A827B5|nr:FHA domain-containing protein [Myxococcus guangdongensis]MCP3057968.1 FHA domain-containing protein [Myxococcus guangdongensis]
MLKLIIEDDEGRKTVVPFVRDEITIGRQEGNTIRLTERNVSRRHARLVRLNGHVVVEDLGSYNGTRINGERIAGQSPLNEGDLIQIGDYDLALQAEGAANAVGPITTKVPARRQETEPDEPEGSEDESPGDGEENDHTPPSLDGADKRRNSTSIIRLDHVEADRPRKLEDIDTKDAPRLVVLTPDELRGQEFACIRTELRIGRTDDNDITLDHRSLSRTHAKLVRENTGEWRVIDMQSANGMTVNGESYAQATLNSGDVVELGHVKLRFLAAGDAADEAEEQGASEGGMSKLPLVAGLVALLLGGGGVIFWMNKQGQLGGTPPPVDPVAVAQTPKPVEPPPEPPVKPPEDVKPPETVVQPGTPEKPPEPPAAQAQPTYEDLLKSANAAFGTKDLNQAADALALFSKTDKSRPEVKELQAKLASEQSVQKQLADVEKSLAAGKLDDAKKLLDASASTQFFDTRHAELKAEFDREKKRQEAAATVVPTGAKTTPEEPAGRPTPASKRRQDEVNQALATAQELLATKKYDEALTALSPCLEPGPSVPGCNLSLGIAYIGIKKYEPAITKLKACVGAEPQNAECHLYLGSAYARIQQNDNGIRHYQEFLKLAPSHPQAKNVKRLISDYDAKVQQ